MLSKLKEMQETQTDVSTGHSKAVVSLAYSYDGRLVATAGADKKSCVISTETGEKLLDLDGEHTEGLNDCCWVDDRLLVTASDDNTLVLWDASYGKPITTFRGHYSYVYCVSCNPVNRAIYSGGFDGNIMVFDVGSGNCMLSFDAHADAICSIDYSPAGNNVFITGSHDGLVRIWDSTSVSGCMTTIYNEARPPISNATYSPNGRYILISSLDSTHRLFDCPDAANAVYVESYRAHLNTKYSILSRLSRYQNRDTIGSYIISGSEDNKIYLWDLNDSLTGATESPIVLEGHSDVVFAVACHPDPTVSQITSASRDGGVKIWGMEASSKGSCSNSSSTSNTENIE